MRKKYILDFCTLICSVLILSSCVGNLLLKGDYKNYSDKASYEVLDMATTHSADAATIYFDAIEQRDFGIKFSRLLLVYRVNGQNVSSSGARSIFDGSAVQAVRLDPGTHTFNICWLSHSGAGFSNSCNLFLRDIELEPRKEYLVRWEINTISKAKHNENKAEIRLLVENVTDGTLVRKSS